MTTLSGSAANLRKLGIEIVSVTQPIDTSTASGQMQQKMLFLFGEFDNQLRKQKCSAGIKEMLLRGDWPTSPPMGYDAIRVNSQRRIVVNAKGKLLKLAFLWKAEEGLTNEVIRQRLREKGLKLYKQRMSEIFRNPFYCGLLVHNMLEGNVIEGNQEKLVSKDLFLQVNGMINKHTHGYSINEENEAIPLKRFLYCAECGRALRGYIVKQRNIYYYKCCTKGCCNNKSAEMLNKTFKQILNVLKLDAIELVDYIKKQAVATFNQLTKDEDNSYQVLQKQYQELKQRINRLEERYINEEINGDLYSRYLDKYLLEKKEIEDNLLKATKQVSNIEECIEVATGIAAKLPLKWLSADYITKQSIQNLVFPEGISYDKKKDECRTTRINWLFAYVAHLQQNTSEKKRGIPALQLNYASLSCSVAGAGLEPTTFGL
jgi:site-specific DNA recombinase